MKEKSKFAKNLRKFPTFCEARLSKSLKAVGLSFDFNPIIYGFIPDFYFPKARLVVEIDGSVHELEHVKENDRLKESVFERGGIRVLRFTNARVMRELGDVVKEICNAVGHKRIEKKSAGAKYGKVRGKRGKSHFAGWSSYRLDPVRRFNPGENKTLYVQKQVPAKKNAIKILRIKRSSDT